MPDVDLNALMETLSDEAESLLPDGVGYVLVLTTIETGEALYDSNIEGEYLGEMLAGLGEQIGDDAAFDEAEKGVVLS